MTTPQELSAFEIALKLWPVVVTSILLVAWFIRLEGKVEKMNESCKSFSERINRLEKLFDRVILVEREVEEVKEMRLKYHKLVNKVSANYLQIQLLKLKVKLDILETEYEEKTKES